MEQGISGFIKNVVPKLLTAISPKLFKSDKRFTERSKQDNQGN